MATYDWSSLMTQWNAEKLADAEYVEYGLTPDVIAAGWLGYPGAGDEQIAAAESRLGIALPPSYRSFLQFSNGWRGTSPFIERVWSTEEVEWFAVRNQDWIDAYVDPWRRDGSPSGPDEQYFVYGDQQGPERIEYLQTALEVSDVGDSAIYLLNPRIVTADGEWEAWFFANWRPGATRYRSFWEMLVAEHESFLRLQG